MGARGPKPGFKKARAEKGAPSSSTPAAKKTAAPRKTAAAKPSEPVAPAAPAAVVIAQAQEEAVVLNAADRENPDKLSGDALRQLAHKRGIARSTLPTMTDEKIRTELRYLAHRQYSDDEPA